MLADIAITAMITLLPFLELRAGIPYGVFATELHWSVVFLASVAANTALGVALYLMLDKLKATATKIAGVEKAYSYYVTRSQERIKPYVERYGWLGLAIFIGIPLPGSGVYSGALGAYLLGMSFRRFMIANVIGVVSAGIIVLAVCLSGSTAFDFLIKRF